MTAARRLPLGADDVHLLWQLGGAGGVPEELWPVGSVAGEAEAHIRTPRALERAADRLRDLGVLRPAAASVPGEGGGGRGAGLVELHPSVAATLACFSAAEITVKTRICLDGAPDRRGWHAVAGDLMAGLVTLGPAGAEGAGFELSTAPATWLGRELQRLIPLAGGSGPPSGRGGASHVLPGVLLATLRSHPTDEPFRTLAAGLCGSLRILLHGARDSVVAQVVWVAAPSGWIALRPGQRDGEAVIDLCPVETSDLGSELAGLLAGMLA